MPLVPKDQRQPTPVRVAAVASRTATSGYARHRWRNAAKWVAVMVLTAGATAAGFLEYQRRIPRPVTTGSLRVETVPAGSEVVIGGKVLGLTPVTLSLAAGPYEIQLGRATDARRFTVDVVAGSSVIQHIEMAPAAAAIATGALRIQTEPSKLPVFIDGAERGVSPLTVDAIPAGAHEITVKSPTGPIRRSVAVQPRETVSLIVVVHGRARRQGRRGGGMAQRVISGAAATPRGRPDHRDDRIGTLMLPAGRSRSQPCQRGARVHRGATRPRHRGKDGAGADRRAQRHDEPQRRAVGRGLRRWRARRRNPIGNLSRPIGRHEVLFRHPQLGERHETLVVTLQGTVRLGVDLRKK